MVSSVFKIFLKIIDKTASVRNLLTNLICYWILKKFLYAIKIAHASMISPVVIYTHSKQVNNRVSFISGGVIMMVVESCGESIFGGGIFIADIITGVNVRHKLRF